MSPDVAADMPAGGTFQGPRASYICPQYDKIEAPTLDAFMRILNGKGAHKWHVLGRIEIEKHWWTEKPTRFWCFLVRQEKVL